MTKTRTRVETKETEYEVDDCGWCGQEVPVDELVTLALEPRVSEYELRHEFVRTLIQELGDDHPAVYKTKSSMVDDVHGHSPIVSKKILPGRARVAPKMMLDVIDEVASDAMQSSDETQVCGFCSESIMDQ